jgi:elongator complex protein 1
VLSSGQSLQAYCLAVSVIDLNPADGNTVVPAVTLVGMSSSGKLVISSPHGQTSLANNVTSFTATPSYLIYITTAHEAHFVHRSVLLSDSHSDNHTEIRRVERGSRIVVAAPSAMSLVLQMPRGNLETIYPRAFVLEVIHDNVKE